MLALTNAVIFTMTRGILERGTILMKNGQIAAVGSTVEIPPNTRVIDVGGNIVTPGLIDAHTHLGVDSEGEGWAGDDVNEATEPITPHVRAVDAINPADIGIREALAGGVTTVMVGPGSANVVGGECAVIKTRGQTVDEMLLRPAAGLKIAFGENPKRVYGERNKMPGTRMGAAALLRDALVKCQNYLQKMTWPVKEGERPPERDLSMETMAKVLRKEMPLRAHAHRADDILTALRIADEFGVEIIIDHGTEGHKIAGTLAKLGVKMVLGPHFVTRSKREVVEKTFAAPGILAGAGVKFALMSDHPVTPARYLNLYAALAVREGLSEEEALKAVTVNAAEILGVAHRVGSIEPGKDADLVVWSGHPLAIQSKPQMVIVSGEIVCPSPAEI